MEGIEMEHPFLENSSDDFCNTVLSQFCKSNNEHHVHICTAIGTMSQELRDQSFPLTPIAYFGATCSALQSLYSATPEGPPSHLIDALSTILSLVVPRINQAILRKKYEHLSHVMIQLLGLKTIGTEGIVSCLKCVKHLLIVGAKGNWSDVAKLYGVFIGYITDDRQKVRKVAHNCLCDVLQNIQSSSMLAPLLAPASEAITKLFERSLLLAGGTTVNASERPNGAQEVLHVLDALKLCLPFMSSKYLNNTLKYFKSLLELRQPLVNRRITDGLNAICIQPTAEVSPEVLLDLLDSFATSVSANVSSADTLTFTARLLGIGMRRVYSVNRQLCVVKLPVVFNSFSDVLGSEHEEAIRAALEALKSLIHECIDENLIKQGVDNIICSNTDLRKSGPTIIEKICATIESLLSYHYAAVWDMSFQVVVFMFDKLGCYSSHLMKGTLQSLADMQKLPDENFPYRRQLHECVGSAVGAMGPESLLTLLPLKLDAQDISESNIWLLPILKQNIVGAHLSFFTNSILSMVGAMKQRSAMLEHEGKIYSARTIDGIVYSLWSLLPSFCNYPMDTAESFKDLEMVFSKALHEEPDVSGIICSSLEILVQQNDNILKGKVDLSDTEISVPKGRAIARYSQQVAECNLKALSLSSHKLLPVLYDVFLESSKDTGGFLQRTIGVLASIADKVRVKRPGKSEEIRIVRVLLTRTMKKLRNVIKEVGDAEKDKNSYSMQIDESSSKSSLSRSAQLYDLAVSLLPGLYAEEYDALFEALIPALKDEEGLIQKKAYKVLSMILRDRAEFISRKTEELLNLMIEALPACHFSAKRHRLDCLYYLIIHVTRDESEQRRHGSITSFMTEILLALKEANKKTRNRAYEILVKIGHACADEDRGGRKENLQQFFNMIAGGLAGETPHMISAAVKGLARLAYEFTDLVSAAFSVLPSTFLLLKRDNKEIIKANLGLLKVLVTKSPAEGLQAHLRSMVEALLGWQDNTKNHFKAKVKLLIEMLIKKCGLDAVKEVMPEEHMKLLTNIRKIKERRDKKLASNSEESRSLMTKATTSRLSRWNHTKIFSEFDDGESENSDAEYMDISSKSKSTLVSESKASLLRSKKSQKAARNLLEDLFDQLDDEPLDLLDQKKTRSALRASGNLKRKPESEDEAEINSEGRLIIHEGDKKQKRVKPPTDDLDVRSKAGSRFSESSRKTQKRRKTSDSGWAYTGTEYASKRAGGDVKRKDKLEPYAYWPLDRKMMSRRPEHRAAARKGMASIVKLTKRLEGKSASSVLSAKRSKTKKRISAKKDEGEVI
ncbi:RRP12-like protein [Capsicum galapagoense]